MGVEYPKEKLVGLGVEKGIPGRENHREWYRKYSMSGKAQVIPCSR